MMANGDLHIRDVTVEDGYKSLRCSTVNTLTGEKKSSEPATLFVKGTSMVVDSATLKDPFLWFAPVDQSQCCNTYQVLHTYHVSRRLHFS